MFGTIKSYFSSYLKPKDVVTIEEIFRPVYILLSILGLFPYSIKFHKTKSYFSIMNRSLYLNLLPAACCLLLTLTFFALHIQALFLISEKSSLTDVIVTQMNYILELVLLLVFCHVAYAQAFINRHRYVRMLNTVVSVWTELPFQPNSQVLTSLRIKSHFVMIGSLSLILIIHLIVNTTRSDGGWKIVLVTVTFILPQMMVYVVLAFLNIVVLLVITILQNIREGLWVYIKERNHCGDGLVEVGSKTVVLPTIRQLELCYGKAYQITRDINRVFQGPMLVIALQAFHAMVSEAHIIYHGVVVNRILTTHEIANCSIWIVWQLLKIYLLVCAGSSLKIQSQKVGQTLHNIPIENRDLRLLLEIQHFSTHIQFQEMVLTVYGYFPVDATLMYNITTAAMMYLIIFVQFDHSATSTSTSTSTSTDE